MAPPKMTPFAIRLRRARKAADLTQDHAAAFVGVAPITYRRWEQAEYEPSASQLVTIAVAFDTTPQMLLEGTDGGAGPAGLVQRVLTLERTLQRLQESVDALRSEPVEPADPDPGATEPNDAGPDDDA